MYEDVHGYMHGYVHGYGHGHVLGHVHGHVHGHAYVIVTMLAESKRLRAASEPTCVHAYACACIRMHAFVVHASNTCTAACDL